jgi:hypothetical protein
MGESKRRRDAAGSSAKVPHEVLDELSRQLIDKGLLIEAGFASLRARAIPPDASPVQLDEMRSAFFAGAQHLFASIMGVLDPDAAEPTEKDMERMGKIDAELRAFINEYQMRQRVLEELARLRLEIAAMAPAEASHAAV